MLRLECVLPAWQICCRTMQSVCVVEMRLNLHLCLSVQLGTLVLGWLSRSEATSANSGFQGLQTLKFRCYGLLWAAMEYSRASHSIVARVLRSIASDPHSALLWSTP